VDGPLKKAKGEKDAGKSHRTPVPTSIKRVGGRRGSNDAAKSSPLSLCFLIHKHHRIIVELWKCCGGGVFLSRPQKGTCIVAGKVYEGKEGSGGGPRVQFFRTEKK